MAENKHTPLPWNVSVSGLTIFAREPATEGSEQEIIVEIAKLKLQLSNSKDPKKFGTDDWDKSQANAERIVHCVNNMPKIEKQKDELMMALLHAKAEIIDLTDADTEANKEHYPHYIDKVIKNA